MIGIGLIGTGRIGRIHGGNVAAHKNARLVSVADALPKAATDFARETGARADSVDALLAAKDVDAVMICSPTDTHSDLIEQAVRAVRLDEAAQDAARENAHDRSRPGRSADTLHAVEVRDGQPVDRALEVAPAPVDAAVVVRRIEVRQVAGAR